MTSDDMFQAIALIRNTRGLNAKKAKLSMFPQMKNMLRSTYNPFMQFNIVPTDSWITDIGQEQFSEKTSQLLSDLYTGDLSGNAARRVLRKHLAELTYTSAQLLIMVINKSMSFGLGVKSINEVFPGLIPTHPIQLAKAYDPRKCNFPCYISPKLDGLRAKFVNGKFYTRNGHEFIGLDKLTEEVLALNNLLGVDFDYDGELMVEGEHFNEISGQLRSFKDVDKAQYFIFDIPSMKDRHQEERVHTMNGICWGNYTHGPALPEDSRLVFVGHYEVNTYEQIDEYYQGFLKQGFEGAIVKQKRGLYQDARTWDWMKLKVTDTKDLIVKGVFEGTGKYVGMCGGIIVDFNGKEVRVGSGLTDSQRAFWFQDPEEIIGQTVEVSYHEVTPDQSLRHPRLTGIRGDK